MIRIFLVEDDQDWSRGLEWKLRHHTDLHWVGSAATMEDAIEQVEAHLIDVLLLDLMLHGQLQGVQLAEKFHRLQPKMKIIVLSNMVQEDLVMKTFQSGVVNYIIKSSAYHDLPDAIRAAHAGIPSIHPIAATLMRGALMRTEQERWKSLLTSREKEILRMVADGATTRQIAEMLYIEDHSVDNVCAKINKKLGVKSRQEAVQLAQERGILD